MEHEGLVRGFKLLNDVGMEIETFISDRHLQNKKWIKDNCPQTIHYFDIWHVAKG